ncbi:MAG: DUF3592 domain-containing protein [Chloroflexi bacterium]|nr:DUF3592 domain-containing protein [Chloroflexota bacterium]
MNPFESNGFSSIIVWICGAGGCFFVGLAIWIVTAILGRRKETKQQTNNDELRKRGVTAPAVVVSARKGMERNLYETHELRIDYVVDVQPEGRPSFRQSFQYWSERRGFIAIAGELVGEAGRKIWVTYDPNNPSQMIFEHYEEEHQKIIGQQELEARRLEFNKLAQINDEIRKLGEGAEAVITKVDDLDLPYPLKGSRAMRLYFDITPKSGAVFQSETYALITDTALGKYSVGKRIYVKFDPRKLERVALDSEKNKSLQ